jgi:hypothetical protein
VTFIGFVLDLPFKLLHPDEVEEEEVLSHEKKE